MREQILEMERQGRMAEAESAAQGWLEAEPASLEARHLLGLVRIRRGHYAAALEALGPALQAAPADAALQASYGRAALLAGDRGRARMAFEAVRQLDPNRIDAHIGLASVALAAGDLQAAESGFRTALRADEDAMEAWLGLGQTLAARGQTEAAMRCFNMALEIHPEDAAAQFSLAQTLRAQGYLDFALRAYECAIELDPELGLARLQRAETLAQRGREAEAAQAFVALRAHPRYGAAALAGLGELRLARDPVQARGLFEQALAVDADLERAVIGLADALTRGGQPAQARQRLETWVEAHPQASAARAVLGERLLRAGEAQAAVALWRAALAQQPGEAILRADLALALERAGDFAQADTEAEHAALGGRWPPLQLLRARAALRDGACGTARDRLLALDESRLNPLQRRHRRHLLGLAALDRGEWLQAEQHFLEMHGGDDGVLPELPDLAELGPRLRAWANEPPLATVAPAPVLLAGLPGSGVHRLAQLLAQQSGCSVHADGFNGGALLLPADDPRLLRAWPAGELDALAHRYARQCRRAGSAGTRRIEWLPHLDARLLPLLRRALPGVRLLLAWRDPEACLLDWLAFGYAQGYPLRDPDAAWTWLQRAGAQLALAAELLPALAVDMDALLAAPPRLPPDMEAFLGAPLRLPAAWPQEARDLGLPITLPPAQREAWRAARATRR